MGLRPGLTAVCVALISFVCALSSARAALEGGALDGTRVILGVPLDARHGAPRVLSLNGAQLVLETGRALVDEAGTLLARVVANKRLPSGTRAQPTRFSTLPRAASSGTGAPKRCGSGRPAGKRTVPFPER